MKLYKHCNQFIMSLRKTRDLPDRLERKFEQVKTIDLDPFLKESKLNRFKDGIKSHAKFIAEWSVTTLIDQNMYHVLVDTGTEEECRFYDKVFRRSFEIKKAKLRIGNMAPFDVILQGFDKIISGYKEEINKVFFEYLNGINKWLNRRRKKEIKRRFIKSVLERSCKIVHSDSKIVKEIKREIKKKVKVLFLPLAVKNLRYIP